MSVFITIVIILLVIFVIFLAFVAGYQTGVSEGQSSCLASMRDIMAKIGSILPTLLTVLGEDTADEGKEKEKENEQAE